MSKFKRFIAIPCVIIFIALYLIGANLIKRIDRVDDINDAVSFVSHTDKTDEPESASNKININKADIDELMEIEGVGEETAKAIVKKREELGGFKSIDEIKRVYGIGDGKFENMRESITVE